MRFPPRAHPATIPAMLRLSALLLLSACTLQNPAYDAPSAGQTTDAPATGDLTSASPAPTTSPSTSSSTSTGGDATDAATSAASTSATTSGVDPSVPGTSRGSDGSTTGDPATTGAPCPDCPACHTCVDGLCVPAGTGTPCDAPLGTPCEDQVYGPSDDGQTRSCHAYAPGSGKCDADGVCLFSCSEMGAAFVTCDTACLRPEFPCTPGASVQDVAIASLCSVDQPTPGCKGSCNSGQGYFDYDVNRCDGAGKCVFDFNDDCDLFKCNDAGCFQQCNGDGQCVDAAHCDNSKCEPD